MKTTYYMAALADRGYVLKYTLGPAPDKVSIHIVASTLYLPVERAAHKLGVKETIDLIMTNGGKPTFKRHDNISFEVAKVLIHQWKEARQRNCTAFWKHEQ